jgi:anti-sigma-K factor RskA
MTVEELEQLAAGLVLGTLDARERENALALEDRNPDLKRAVQHLGRMLGPLETVSPQEAPPSHLFEAIEPASMRHTPRCPGQSRCTPALTIGTPSARAWMRRSFGATRRPIVSHC